tara:strand:- start:2 stop:652 length:651 start_codon:yes stop_codon:yes gene_type:complete
MDKIILIGGGGHALSCADVIESKKDYVIAGVVLKNKKDKNKNKFNVVGYENDLLKLRKKYKYAHIAVGQIKNYKIRFELYKILKKYNYILPPLIPKFSYVSPKAKIEEGTILMNGTIVNSNARIGKNCIINTGVIIEHGAKIGNFNHISTGVIINGDVKIGEKNFIGSGTILYNQANVGSKKIIPALSKIKKIGKNPIYGYSGESKITKIPKKVTR